MIFNQEIIKNYYSLNDKFANINNDLKLYEITLKKDLEEEFNNRKNTIQEMIQQEEVVSTEDFRKELKLLNNVFNEIYKEIKLLRNS